MMSFFYVKRGEIEEMDTEIKNSSDDSGGRILSKDDVVSSISSK